MFYSNDFTILLNVFGWQSRSFFLVSWLQYLAKNIALLVRNFLGEKICQNPFSAILKLK